MVDTLRGVNMCFFYFYARWSWFSKTVDSTTITGCRRYGWNAAYVSAHGKRYTKALVEPGNFHQRHKSHYNQVPIKSARAVRAIKVESESSISGSDISETDIDVDRRRICASTVSNQVKLNQDHRISHKGADRIELRDHGERSKACSHCGSIKHNDRGYWKILTWQKCGRKGHPSETYFCACADVEQ